MKFLSRTFVLLVLAAGATVHGEIWNHTNQSKVFDFQLNITGITNEDGRVDECAVTITVFNKLTKTTTQTIPCGPRSVFGWAFTRRDSTGTNATKAMHTGADGDVGDFLVEDFNFDNRDDFALKSESHANGEPYYEYYIQNESGQFVRDAFLSEEMQIFPYISTSNKTLITFHATMVDSTTTTYKLNAATGKWRVLKCEVTMNDDFITIGPDHDWTVSIGDRWFGLVCFPLKTDVCYGIGSVEIPVHIYTLMGIGSGVPLLACAIYVYAQRRRHRAQVAANRIISPAAPAP